MGLNSNFRRTHLSNATRKLKNKIWFLLIVRRSIVVVTIVANFIQQKQCKAKRDFLMPNKIPETEDFFRRESEKIIVLDQGIRGLPSNRHGRHHRDEIV